MQTVASLLAEIQSKYPFIDAKALKNATPKELDKLKRNIPEVLELDRMLRLAETDRKARAKRYLQMRG